MRTNWAGNYVYRASELRSVMKVSEVQETVRAARNVRITGNLFGQERSAKSGTFGPIADWNSSGASGNVWRNNRFFDGKPVEPQENSGP